MPMWLFGRRRRKSDGPQPVSESKAASKNNARPASPKVLGSHGITRKNSYNKSRRKGRASSPRASPTALRAEEKENQYPNNPFKDVLDPIDSRENIAALPLASVPTSSPHLRPITVRDNIPSIPYTSGPYNDSGASLASARGKLQRPQSLQKHDSMPPRRKSTRRKVDHAREEEIKAMFGPSAPIPMKRPATFSGTILRRESKKIKGGLNRNCERPTSNVSLPLAESIHSSMSGASELRSFKVSALELFSARPALHYASSAPYSSSPINSFRAESRREKQPSSDLRLEGVQEKQEDPTRDERSKNRIGDLADEMDTSSLREMMERDARRRAKKERADADKLRRRLERRAEKQRAKEARNAGKEPETGTLERRRAPSIGLGIDNHTTTPVRSPKTPVSPQNVPTANPFDDVAMVDGPLVPSGYRLESPVRSLERPVHPLERPMHPLEREALENVQRNDIRTEPERPVPQRHTSSPDRATSPSPIQTPYEEAEIHTAIEQKLDYKRASMQASPPASPRHVREPSNISQIADLVSAKAPTPDPLHTTATIEEPKKRRSSEASSKRMGMWASIFRRGGRRTSSENARGASPSEASFSNTSRESMSRQPLPAHLVAPSPPPPSSRASGAPVRTMSKFREDLPEHPLSPPDSRVQSPETADSAPISIPARRGQQPPSRLETSADRQQQPTPDTDGSDGLDSPVSPDPRRSASGLMSRSMASVDSEGSWLSGKPMKRSSTRQKYRNSVSSVRKTTEDFNASYEELGMEDDEYFRRLTPTPEQYLVPAAEVSRKPSSNAMGPSATVDVDGEPRDNVAEPAAESEVLHSGVARTPTVVRREPYARVKSQEGLLNLYEDENDSPQRSPSDPEDLGAETPEPEPEQVKIARAKSVDLGKQHVRQVSAGSARLLDIKRISTQMTSPPTSAPQSAI